MDLSRWGLRRFSRITDRYRNFREFLGDVLEGDRSLLATEQDKPEPAFAVRSDFETLLKTPLPSRGVASLSIETIFEMLAPYFEAGFCLRSAPESGTRLDSMFLFGKIFEPPTDDGERVSLPLPELQRGQVIIGRVKPVLAAFQLQALNSLGEAQAFAFSPVRGRVILLICNRPHIWQVDAVTNAVEVVTELVERSARHKIHAKGPLRDRQSK